MYVTSNAMNLAVTQHLKSYLDNLATLAEAIRPVVSVKEVQAFKLDPVQVPGVSAIVSLSKPARNNSRSTAADNNTQRDESAVTLQPWKDATSGTTAFDPSSASSSHKSASALPRPPHPRTLRRRLEYHHNAPQSDSDS